MTAAAEIIAKRARRMPEREGALVWSLAGGAVTVLVYVMLLQGSYAFNPLDLIFAANAALHGVVIGGILGLLWYLLVRGKVAKARTAVAEQLHAAEAMREAEKQARIAEMKAREALP